MMAHRKSGRVFRNSQPSASDVMQFVFRVKASGMEGAWHSLGDAADLTAQFKSSHDQYCFSIEAMRVSDGEIMQLGEQCADDTIGDLGPRPKPYQTCFENDGPAFDAQREMYRKAWCSDNAEACTQHADTYEDACGDYTTIFHHGRHPCGCGPDRGCRSMPCRCGHHSDDAPMLGPDPRSSRDRASSSCAVHPARAGSAMLAGWFAVAAVWLMRRRACR